MRTFAIDPGPVESAYVIWDGVSILEKGKVPNLTLLSLIGSHGLRSRFVCEMIASYGMAVGAEVFETCIWIGRFVEAAGGSEQMDRVVRMKVKMHLCHQAKAKDSNIRQALIDRFGPPGVKKTPGLTYGLSGDTWAAFALAATYHDHLTDPTGNKVSAIIHKLPH